MGSESPKVANYTSIRERKASFRNTADTYKKYILSPRPNGSVLNNMECVCVARCAREAAFCGDELPSGVCMKPGIDFFEWMQNSKNAVSKEINEYVGGEKGIFLTRTIHAIILHQHRLDKKWYEKTLLAIPSIFLVDKMGAMTQEEITIKSTAIFCEILAIATASHGIQMACIANQEKILELPSVEEAIKISKSYPTPEDFNMVSFLKKVRRDEKVSDWSPYYLTEDIDLESPECKKMSKKDLDNILLHVKHLQQPRICSYMAPIDAMAMMEVMFDLYISHSDKGEFGEMSSRSKGVNRVHLETVASGYAKAVNCGF